jgi:cell division protein FtsZ
LSTEELVEARLSSRTPRVSVVGVGGAGNNLLTSVIGEVVGPGHCVAVNTDRAELSRSPAVNKVLLDEGVVGGGFSASFRLSPVKMMELSAYRVRPFTATSDLTIVVAGLGGGTATGTAPLIAQSTRSSLQPVISVVAIPYIHERERRFVALRGLKHMIESCDCTVVIDNAMDDGLAHGGERQADEKAFQAVRSLTELVSRVEPAVLPNAIRILSLGQIAIIASAPMGSTGSIQGAIIEALRGPSANLPLSKTSGAVLLYRGRSKLSEGDAAKAYEALESIIGKKIAFFHTSVESPSEPILSLLLTGYDYGTAVHAFVDFIEDLYDVEYGLPAPKSFLGVEIPLFQMEMDEP